MSIRIATLDDAAAITRIHVDSWRCAYRGLVPDEKLDALDYDRRAEQFRQSLVEAEPGTCVIEDGGVVAGFCTFGACRDGDATSETGEVWGIYLAPTHWRRGLGRALLRHAEQQLAAHGCRSVRLWVLAGNQSARDFYEAMAYRPDGQIHTIEIGRPLAVVRYAKALPQAD